MSNPFQNYTTAGVAQQNWERNRRRVNQRSPEQRAKASLRSELYHLRHKYPDAGYDSLYKKLYQFAWVEKYDETFDDLDLVVDELVSQEVKNEQTR